MATRTIPVNIVMPSADGDTYPARVDLAPNIVEWPAFAQDVEAEWYGEVSVPPEFVGTAKLLISFAWNATTGVARFTIGVGPPADGETYDVTFTDETAIDVTVPGTAYFRKDVTFPASGSLGATIAANDHLQIRIVKNGTHANDTVAAVTYMPKVRFQYSDT